MSGALATDLELSPITLVAIATKDTGTPTTAGTEQARAIEREKSCVHDREGSSTEITDIDVIGAPFVAGYV
jgi:hypothetical protein